MIYFVLMLRYQTEENNIMKAYLVERPARDWCQDYAMVIIAQDERQAERRR